MGRNGNIAPVPYYMNVVRMLVDAFMLLREVGIEDEVVYDLENFLNEYWPELLFEA